MAVKRAELLDISTQYWYQEEPGETVITDLSQIMAGVLLNLTGAGIGVIPSGPEQGLALINNVSGSQYQALESFITNSFNGIDLETTGAHFVYPESRPLWNKNFVRSRDCQIYETEFMNYIKKTIVTQSRDLLNMFFNTRMALDPALSGTIPVTEANTLGQIARSQMGMPGDGFFYVYVTNLSASNVYFNNLTIKRWKFDSSCVLRSETVEMSIPRACDSGMQVRVSYDYYPYGLTWQNPDLQEEESKLHDHAYQDKEFMFGEYDGMVGLALFVYLKQKSRPESIKTALLPSPDSFGRPHD